MVKITSALFILGSFVVAGFASVIEQRDTGNVKTDLQRIARDISKLDDAVSHVHGSATVAQAMAIQSTGSDLKKSLDKGTKDVRGHKPSKSDAEKVFSEVKALEPKVIDLLKNIAAKKDAFTHLPVGGAAVIKQALESLFKSTTEFESALIKITPAHIKGEAEKIKHAIDAAFHKAIAAYS
ncbi:hypothetical protein AX17_002257 [Amanita inopinata Kibby_2008]|nr:hypothetical protein AX17_002257 [Amanita inopinata Kibby_2008]